MPGSKKKPKAKPLILASASPRRRHLMRQAGYKFKVIPSHTSERIPSGHSPQGIVKHLALKKAKDISKKHPYAIVLGADTLVFLKKKIIGKPKNKKHAVRILKSLSNQWQRVITGVAVAWEGGKQTKTGATVSSVKIKKLSEADIKRASHKHLDKAGAYAIQEKNDPFVEKLVGDYDNVVGLPMKLVKNLLKKFTLHTPRVRKKRSAEI